MKTLKYIYILFLAGLLGLGACSDYLDQMPEEQLKVADLYKSKDDVVRVLTDIYDKHPQINNFQNFIGLGADDLFFNWNNYNPYYKDLGQLSASSPIYNDEKWSWRGYYNSIRASIDFLNRIHECQDEKLNEQTRTWWIGEAYFLQAYFNFLLLEQYGPMPIVDKVYDGSEMISKMNEGIPRAHVDTVVNHIDKLLLEAMARLDPSYQQSDPDRAGRANGTAARFLRARLWLYAASPLYNGMKTTDGKDLSNLCPEDNEGKKLINTTVDVEKWKKAMDYAKEAIEYAENEAQFSIMREGMTGNINTNNSYWYYKRIFSYPRGGEASPEMIFYKQNFSTGDWNNHALPISWALYSGICPTWAHTEEYFMANGLMPEDDPAYRTATGFSSYNSGSFNNIQLYNKFKKREPRFYSNILFPDQYSYAMLDSTKESFTTKWSNFTSTASENETYFRPYYNGQDGYERKTGRDYSVSGMLGIKWVMPTASKTTRGDNAVPIFRLTELYLNYTEAAFEYYAAKGMNPLNQPDVFFYWDQIRDRAGIKGVREAYAKAGITLTTNKLRELIHRERRIEFHAEGHRYFDNRRWLDAEREGNPKQGFDIMKNTGTGFWNIVTFITPVWYPDNRMYFMPIPQTEINKNPKLTQNVGWDKGDDE